ncbi:protein Skeletor, isoforms B/C-like isoform X2 [Antedon mediterranea]|uniref:protein Skeletor, isoforms B/C-like isoform X2 n=1 Tax=Antedon mediterranea TaxID=105859 RepID=UPI003AF5042C
MEKFNLVIVIVSSLFTVIHAQEFANYFGKKIGDFTTFAHRVSGSVHAIDSTTLWVRGFNYDGTAPDAFFWAGVSGSNPSSGGEIIPDENGSDNPLGAYTNANIILRLPAGRVITDYNWISIWCRLFAANFGQIIISSNFQPPAPFSLGVLGFNPRVHDVHADDVIIMDSQTVKFVNLDYDGRGPAAYFWVGEGTRPGTSGYRVPDENGSKTTVLRRYNGEDITIKFDGVLTVFDIGHIGLWCEIARQNFGDVDVPGSLSVPPSGIPQVQQPTPEPSLENCEELSDTFQVFWQVTGQSIDIELKGVVDTDTYMAFGLSGSDSMTSMVGSDVTVAWFDGTQGRAVDYNLNAYAQCSGGNGACADTESSNLGSDSVTNVEGSVKDGITSIKYTRQLNTGDATDIVIPVDSSVYISWAIGPINPDGRAVKHATRTPTGGSNGNGKQINFGRGASNTCQPLAPGDKPPALEPWAANTLPPTITTFDVKIGPSGGERGYTAVTGNAGWGIALYINGVLIPELKVQRGLNYTFRIFGGSNPARPADYHPVYITNDAAGGLASLSSNEIPGDLEIYAGPFNGSLCAYVSNGEDQADNSDTFAEYFETLTEECVTPSEPVEFVWTPDENTPDLVYYQCYTHRFLGWKINVVDDITSGAQSAKINQNSLLLGFILVTIVLIFRL